MKKSGRSKKINKYLFMAAVVLFIAVVVLFSILFFSKEDVINSPNGEKSVSSPSIFYLSSDELEDFSRKSEQGDADAPFKLYLYYMFSKDGSSAAIDWLEVAADNGNPMAQYNMAFEMKKTNNFSEALYWACMAKANGDNGVEKLINELREIESREKGGTSNVGCGNNE